MPAVVAGAAMDEAGSEESGGRSPAEVIASGLARLADFQHDDGGWGWWKDDETNDFMTAYVVEGLARCRRLKQPRPQGRARTSVRATCSASGARSGCADTGRKASATSTWKSMRSTPWPKRLGPRMICI